MSSCSSSSSSSEERSSPQLSRTERNKIIQSKADKSFLTSGGNNVVLMDGQMVSLTLFLLHNIINNTAIRCQYCINVMYICVVIDLP
ncbi:hypothetical protein [Rachiplusia nu nucleopolyhedrovirus]|uniref:Uncharacterized protein n=1 Tax=Rachiplusia nu nucleopolyhedrovirus TaxID=2605775 RepID=A0AAF1DB43_9ABAC|nr:hypothetical protein QKQ55_gp005 [Rachiplusia nu nucleopolyhedrovirus]QEI03641.1 hypothetical protein [Rachiplusia nu nucleopolyhedrovirus]